MVMLMAICSACGINGGNTGSQGGTENAAPAKLTAPTVALIDDTATWSANASADKFEISVDGNLSYIENSVTSRKLVDGQTFKIRAVGDGTNYTNSDWSNSVTYEKSIAKYTIVWKNGDTILETDTDVVEGMTPTYDGAEPTRNADAQYSYVFAGWTPEVAEANGDLTYTATFTPIVNKYTVTWKNGDTILETDENVEYGTTPAYNGAEPKKAADTQYVYVFSGWSPIVSEVVGDVTYIAQFTSAPYSCTIVWKNGDTILETDESVAYGSNPSYDGATPIKDATAQYTYIFSGWEPQISPVTESVSYQAQFAETIRSYTVTFCSEDGSTVLDSVAVPYGSNAVYSKSEPVKNATAEHTYVFEKWVTTQGGSIADDLTNVIGDRSVYASFKKFVRTVTVYIVPNNTDYGTVSVSALNNVPYGAKIIVNGNVVSINGQAITAQANTATDQYTYVFENWATDATVGNDTVIIANFSRYVNSYTVTWMNGDTVLEVDENVTYGTTPVYNGTQPTKDADNENIYTFSGWSSAISSVIGDITYIASFTTTANKHTVIFYDDDGATELGRVVVGHGETATYPNALPTKESTAQITYTFDKWVTTQNGETEAVFTDITEEKSVYATYITNARTYIVTFCDYDGTVLSRVDVAYGDSATAPGDPERDEFRFDGWDKIYTNITDALIVKAKYVQQFTVEFLDYDNSIIDTQLVDYNGNAIAPEDPVRNNYRFTGWNTTFTNIVSDLTVKAEYIRQYQVIFLDYDGTVLKEVMVDAGSTATAPNDPMLEGYIFDGWNKTVKDISSDLTVTATYKAKTYTVKFVMPDGTLIGEAQIVEHGFSAIVPEYPEFFLEGAGDYTKVYGFTTWNKSFDVVTEDLEIEAVYESDYTKPVIIIEFSQERNGDAKLYIINPELMILNAIELLIDYSTSVGKISINSATVNSASPLWVEKSDGSNNNQYVINNNESIFTFAWSDANGKQFDWCSKVITFSFSTDGAVVSEDSFVIINCSAIVSDGNGENLEKITPMVIYR